MSSYYRSQTSQPRRPSPNSRQQQQHEADDWDTDPDFIRDMDEMDQRWGGARRTVGSINMGQLIDDVQRDHRSGQQKFSHPSQRDYSHGFGGKFGVQRDRKDESAQDYDYHEKLSKHSSQEFTKKVYSSSGASSGAGLGAEPGASVSEAKRRFMDASGGVERRSPSELRDEIRRATFRPPTGPTSATSAAAARLNPSQRGRPSEEEAAAEETIIRQEKKSSASSRSRAAHDVPAAFKSIQEKIDAFRREFDDKLGEGGAGAKQEHFERSSSSEKKSTFVSSRGGSPAGPGPGPAPASTGGIAKSLSERFESMCRDNGDDFRRKTEARRRDFFDQVRQQVRETRRGLAGFEGGPGGGGGGADELDELERQLRQGLERATGGADAGAAGGGGGGGGGGGAQAPGNLSGAKPKVYTKREFTQERVVSKIVKENDKVVENETKRDVRRSESRHGSSSEEEEEAAAAAAAEKSEPRQVRPPPAPAAGSPTGGQRGGAGLMARTLYDYAAAEPDELSFDVDDLITNIDKIDAGWYKGTMTARDGSKREGLFPANYVKLLNDTADH